MGYFKDGKWQPSANEIAAGEYHEPGKTAALAETFLKDAARYRHIKRKHIADHACDRYDGARLWFAVYDPEEKGLDAAIDAAIAEERS